MKKMILFFAVMIFFSGLCAQPVGLQNCGNTCFLNATLQMLFSMNGLSNILKGNENSYDKSDIVYTYINLVKQFESSKSTISCNEGGALKSVDTLAYSLIDKRCGTQGDSTEFLVKFLGRCLEGLAGLSVRDQLQQLLTFNQISITQCPAIEKYQEYTGRYQATDENGVVQPDLYLQVEVQDNQGNNFNILEECFDNYFKVEKLDDPKNKFYDETNKALRTDCTKRFVLDGTSLPHYFIVSLKRYNAFAQKLGHSVEIPTNLNINSYLENPSSVPAVKSNYRLKAAVVQGGSTGGGHYWAYIQYDDNWYRCDDSSITEVSWPVADINNAYMVLYEKRDMKWGEYFKWKGLQDKRRQNMKNSKQIKKLSGDLQNLQRSLNDLKASLARLPKN